MTNRCANFAATGVALFVALVQVTAVDAAEVKVFTARAIATVLEKVGPEFERTTGHKLNVISGFGPVFLRQINAGESFDVFVSATSYSTCRSTAGAFIARLYRGLEAWRSTFLVSLHSRCCRLSTTC